MAQILINSRLAAQGRCPLCQDTGVAQVFFRTGMGVQFARHDGTPAWSPQRVADEAVRRADLDPANPLRATMVRGPAGPRGLLRRPRRCGGR